MIDACNSDLALRDITILMFLVDKDVRATELISMDYEDLDIFSGAVKVMHGKGDKQRIVYLGKKPLRQMRKYLKTRVELFDLSGKSLYRVMACEEKIKVDLLFSKIGIKLDPEIRCGDLTIAEQQKIALSGNYRSYTDLLNEANEKGRVIDNDWNSIAYGLGAFISISETGTNNRVMTSLFV